jgi:hypothetical protein
VNKDNLGFYLVGWKKIYNKVLALIESKRTGYDIIWNFNDSIYSKFNWATPIELSLDELYRIRAQQLRNKYDYISLQFSGGADSTNVLHAFIDNNIFIDEIVMQIPEMDRKNLKDFDMSERNIYGEIEYVAIPYLKSLGFKLHPNTKIIMQDICKSALELFKNDDWIESHVPSGHVTISTMARQAMPIFDQTLLRLSEKQNVCQLIGVDKPMVYFDGTEYYAYFADTSVTHANPTELSYENKRNNGFQTEFFYWTADLPEIVVKQAQVIKAACEVDTAKQLLWKQALVKHLGEFRDTLDPIIYPAIPRPKFQTKKPSTILVGNSMDEWFWKTASADIQNNYIEGIKYLKTNILHTRGIDGDVANGFNSIKTRFYKL